VPEIRAPAAEGCSESLAQARVIARFRPTAWLRLDLARTAVNRKDMNVADEQIAAAGHTVTGAFSTAASADVAPADNAIRPDQIRASEMIGELIFDVSDRKLGNVVDIVLDPDGTVGAFVIGMRGGNGAVVKQLAVSMAGLKSDNDHETRLTARPISSSRPRAISWSAGTPPSLRVLRVMPPPRQGAQAP
jgi:sporulation protein YlmC with PRC-barrel domain